MDGVVQGAAAEAFGKTAPSEISFRNAGPVRVSASAPSATSLRSESIETSRTFGRGAPPEAGQPAEATAAARIREARRRRPPRTAFESN